jgi:hypothetical protein
MKEAVIVPFELIRWLSYNVDISKADNNEICVEILKEGSFIVRTKFARELYHFPVLRYYV